MSTINANSSGVVITGDTSGTLNLATGGTTRTTIDGSGNVGIGGTAGADTKVHALGTYPTSGGNTRVFYANGTIPSGTTSNGYGYVSVPSIENASFTLGNLYGFWAGQGTKGASATITNQYGFFVSSGLSEATNNYGFYSNLASGSGRWNFYAAGSAVNYFGGDVRIGTTADLGQGARLNIESLSGEADLITLRYNNATAGKHWRIAIDSASTFLLLNQAGTPVGVQLTDGGNSWSSYSDERQKTDLKLIEDAANKVGTLRAVTGRYTFDEETESRSFLIAQDVQKVLPEAVKQGADGNLLLAYQDVIPLLTKAIQEQQAMIDELKAKVVALETK